MSHTMENKYEENDPKSPSMESSIPIMGENEEKNSSQEASDTGNNEMSSEKDGAAETISKLSQELDEYKDKYLRTAAEIENLRRRMEKDRSDLLKYGAEKLLKDMIPVLDSFEKAVEGASAEGASESDTLKDGILLVQKQLFEVLKSNGLSIIEAAGEKFDPNIHQGIQKVESDKVKEDTVKDQFATGYMLNDRLIRPAMVSVLVPKEDEK